MTNGQLMSILKILDPNMEVCLILNDVGTVYNHKREEDRPKTWRGPALALLDPIPLGYSDGLAAHGWIERVYVKRGRFGRMEIIISNGGHKVHLQPEDDGPDDPQQSFDARKPELPKGPPVVSAAPQLPPAPEIRSRWQTPGSGKG